MERDGKWKVMLGLGKLLLFVVKDPRKLDDSAVENLSCVLIPPYVSMEQSHEPSWRMMQLLHPLKLAATTRAVNIPLMYIHLQEVKAPMK